MVAKLGKDKFGADTLENMKTNNVNTEHILSTADAPSGVASITVDRHGRNSIIIVAGANDMLTKEEARLFTSSTMSTSG